MSTRKTHGAGRLAFVIAGLLVACTGTRTENPAPTAPVAMTQDRVTLPPIQRETRSPSGSYAFVVAAEDQWQQSSKASGELLRVAGERRTSAWKKSLPEQFGPRFVLLNDRGDVLLVDESVNIVTRHALVLFNTNGRELAHLTFDDIQTLTGVSGSTIVQMARYGSWLTSVPQLDTSGDNATFTAGGKTVSISLTDGHVSVIR
jgi:hypothetical protein